MSRRRRHPVPYEVTLPGFHPFICPALLHTAARFKVYQTYVRIYDPNCSFVEFVKVCKIRRLYTAEHPRRKPPPPPKPPRPVPIPKIASDAEIVAFYATHTARKTEDRYRVSLARIREIVGRLAPELLRGRGDRRFSLPGKMAAVAKRRAELRARFAELPPGTSVRLGAAILGVSHGTLRFSLNPPPLKGSAR